MHIHMRVFPGQATSRDHSGTNGPVTDVTRPRITGDGIVTRRSSGRKGACAVWLVTYPRER